MNKLYSRWVIIQDLTKLTGWDWWVFVGWLIVFWCGVGLWFCCCYCVVCVVLCLWFFSVGEAFLVAFLKLIILQLLKTVEVFWHFCCIIQLLQKVEIVMCIGVLWIYFRYCTVKFVLHNNWMYQDEEKDVSFKDEYFPVLNHSIWRCGTEINQILVFDSFCCDDLSLCLVNLHKITIFTFVFHGADFTGKIPLESIKPLSAFS